MLGPLHGRGRLAALLAHLSQVEKSPIQGTTSLDQAAKAFLARRAEPGLVLLVSDFLDPAGAEKAATRLQAAGSEPFLVHLASPDEVEATLGLDQDLVDAETGEVVAVDLDRSAVAAYAQRFEAFAASLERMARAHEIGYAFARTDLPFEDLVLELCRRHALAA